MKRWLTGAALPWIMAAGCSEDTTGTASSTNASASATTSTTTSTAASTGSAAGTGGSGGDGGTTTTGGSAGHGGTGGSAPQSQRAYYWGDFDTDAVIQVASIEWPPGTKAVLPLQGLSGGAAINSVALSPSGTQIAVAGRDTSNASFVLQIYAADGMGAPVTVVDVAQQLNPNGQIDNVAFSPDGTRIAYTADLDGSFLTGVYVSPANGSSAPKLVTQTPSGSLDAFGFAWSDPQHLVYWGDLEIDLVAGIWSVDVTAPTPAPVALVPANLLTDTGDVRTHPQIDAQGRAYFKSMHESAAYLYRNDIAASNLEIVPGTDVLMNQNGQAEIGSFAVSADGTRLAFTADAPDADLYQVFVLDLSGTTPTLVSNVITTPTTTGILGPELNVPIAWRPDGSMLAVQADWEADNVFSAYLLPTSGTAGGLRILQASGSQDVKKLAFTSDSQRLIARADLVTNNFEELFATTDFTTQDQSALPLRIEEAAAESAEVYNFVIAP